MTDQRHPCMEVSNSERTLRDALRRGCKIGHKMFQTFQEYATSIVPLPSHYVIDIGTANDSLDHTH